jgi:16S rRNA (guanine527-N7)-methyltransferase
MKSQINWIYQSVQLKPDYSDHVTCFSPFLRNIISVKENFNASDLFEYFPSLTENQISIFNQLIPLYRFWNQKINLISQNDIENLFIRHILHSLAIAKIVGFRIGEKIIDVGTGGGFPGIPLAIMFPDSDFTLIDSIGKKIKVVEEIVNSLNLHNVSPLKARSNEIKGRYEFVTGRAVTAFPKFYEDVKHLIPINGKIIYLKGGNFDEEISGYKSLKVYQISDFFKNEFFETKKIIYFTKN